MAGRTAAQERVAKAQAELKEAMTPTPPAKDAPQMEEVQAELARQLAGLAEALQVALRTQEQQHARMNRFDEALQKMHSVMAEFSGILQELAGVRR